MFYTLENVSLQLGHVYMRKDQLVRETMSLLNNQEGRVTEEDIVGCIEMMQSEGKLLLKKNECIWHRYSTLKKVL